jgi:hypothetical protein
MTRDERIRKLKNSSDTAIWAANEIEALESKNADLFYSLTDCLSQLQKLINGSPVDSDMITTELHSRICLYNNDSAALGPLLNQDEERLSQPFNCNEYTEKLLDIYEFRKRPL